MCWCTYNYMTWQHMIWHDMTLHGNTWQTWHTWHTWHILHTWHALHTWHTLHTLQTVHTWHTGHTWHTLQTLQTHCISWGFNPWHDMTLLHILTYGSCAHGKGKSAFWLWSSVVSVLISVTTDMSPTGDLLVTSIFAGEVSSRACSGAFMCCAGMALSQWQHTLWGNRKIYIRYLIVRSVGHGSLSKRRKMGALWSERCDDIAAQGSLSLVMHLCLCWLTLPLHQTSMAHTSYY